MASKFTTSKQVENHFGWLRGKALDGYKDLQRLDGGGLSKLLLAGQINGFELVKYGQQVERDIKRIETRLRMLDMEEKSCLRELRARGVTYA